MCLRRFTCHTCHFRLKVGGGQLSLCLACRAARNVGTFQPSPPPASQQQKSHTEHKCHHPLAIPSWEHVDKLCSCRWSHPPAQGELWLRQLCLYLCTFKGLTSSYSSRLKGCSASFSLPSLPPMAHSAQSQGATAGIRQPGWSK